MSRGVREQRAAGELRIGDEPAPDVPGAIEHRRHVRVEANAGDVDEKVSVDLAEVDRRAACAASAEAMATSGRRLMRSSLARPLPDPAGMIPSGTSSNASADATSLIVPSPPQAITSRAPLRTADFASSRAWPRALGDEYLGAIAVAFDGAHRQPGARRDGASPAPAGNRIDDDCDGQGAALLQGQAAGRVVGEIDQLDDFGRNPWRRDNGR